MILLTRAIWSEMLTRWKDWYSHEYDLILWFYKDFGLHSSACHLDEMQIWFSKPAANQILDRKAMFLFERGAVIWSPVFTLISPHPSSWISSSEFISCHREREVRQTNETRGGRPGGRGETLTVIGQLTSKETEVFWHVKYATQQEEGQRRAWLPERVRVLQTAERSACRSRAECTSVITG